ncbi:VOC family protein [Streptomyces sp. NPDC005373]|uniref:VOC family protein n=1 Tax=Streptomyces sp. NPDC005373 TaxID=3156879 RepID=UPI0033AAF890
MTGNISPTIGAPPPVTVLSYVVLEVADLDAWIRFAEDLLDVSVERNGSLARIRIDSRTWRWELRAADEDRLVALGWELPDDAAVAAWLAAVPGAVAGDAASRSAGSLAYVTGPGGVRHEVVARPRRATDPCVTGQGTRFVAENLGPGHAVLVLDGLDEAKAFAHDVLGLHLTDTITRGERVVTFLHCRGRAARHHSLALVKGTGPAQLNHLMLEVTGLDMVGRAYERCESAGVVSRGLGMHTNDRMVSFYCRTPSGYEIEYGWGGVVVDDADWQPVDHPASSIWGHDKR